MFLNILSKVNQVHTHLVFADCYWFDQTLTAAQRSRASLREKTQQHNNSNTLHPLDGSDLALNKLSTSVCEAPTSLVFHTQLFIFIFGCLSPLPGCC